jgi:hypothetical protein
LRNWKIIWNSKEGAYSEWKNYKKGSNIAKHAWDMQHAIDFENGIVIDSGNYRTRKTLESWHTAIITNSDNNSKPLLKQYAMLVN